MVKAALELNIDQRAVTNGSYPGAELERWCCADGLHDPKVHGPKAFQEGLARPARADARSI